jgi:hypothetical protein
MGANHSTRVGIRAVNKESGKVVVVDPSPCKMRDRVLAFH